MRSSDITVSIVSHRQNALTNQLLQDVDRHCAAVVSVVLTENVPDGIALGSAARRPVEVIRNAHAQGFGANHNAAFARCRTPYFCVANPDLRLAADPLAPLLDTLERLDAAVAGPLVRTPAGAIEDSARRYPTANGLFRKLLHGSSGPDYPTDTGAQQVDWVAGMFMLFRAEDYQRVGGFDEGYFLYYEDVDICHRLRAAGRPVVYDPRVEVIHDARRASRRELRLALHHVRSALRFLARSG